MSGGWLIFGAVFWLAAWALMGLIAAGRAETESARRGVAFLLREQHADGAWQEEYWTGTGFPGVFYLRYHLYGIYFPLLALACYRRALEQQRPGWAQSA